MKKQNDIPNCPTEEHVISYLIKINSVVATGVSLIVCTYYIRIGTILYINVITYKLRCIFLVGKVSAKKLAILLEVQSVSDLGRRPTFIVYLLENFQKNIQQGKVPLTGTDQLHCGANLLYKIDRQFSNKYL